MKRQFVASLQEGDIINDYFVAARKDLRDQPSGGKFLGLVFKDKTGEVGGILWSNAGAVSRLFEQGDVVNVRGVVSSYQDRLQIRVEQVLPLKADEYEVGDLVFAPENAPETSGAFIELMGTVKNEWLRRLLDSFIEDQDFMDCFMSAAAGKRWHHAYRGGLVRHCYEIARIASLMAELFPQIDRDLLLTGVFLHDIGKLEEMRHELVVDYTTAGKLLGHLNIGVEMARKRIDAIPDFPQDLRMQIFHLILSHHGEMTNGSPVLPKTLEAIVLYHCDNLDAQTDAFQRVIEDARQKGREWSEYLPPIDRQIWTKGESL
jgi:3'-5' exoribonuclease